MEKLGAGDILRIYGVIAPSFRDVQAMMDAYGIILDSLDENKHANILKDEPMFIIKFSIPEKWEGEDFEGLDLNTDTSELKKDFKTAVSNSLMELWKAEDGANPMSSEFYRECLKSVRYLCRVRKGETWTERKMQEAAARTIAILAQLDTFAKQQDEYDEV